MIFTFKLLRRLLLIQEVFSEVFSFAMVVNFSLYIHFAFEKITKLL